MNKIKNKMDKKEIRRLVLERRGLIGPDGRAARDRAIGERLLALDAYDSAKTVLFYASFRDEVGTIGPMEGAIRSGKRVMLPRVEGPELALYYIGSVSGLQKGFMGIPEPTGTKDGPAAGVNEADVIIVPGVAFDMEGGRLGYGKGYYDRLLAGRERAIPLVALAYEAQLYEGMLPLMPHDVRMDFVITEKRTIRVSVSVGGAGGKEGEGAKNGR